MDFTGAVEQHLAAVAARDLPAYLATVRDDVSLILLNGRLLRGREAVAGLHQDWFADPDWSWTLSPVHSAVAGDTGVAVFEVDYDDLDGDGKPYSTRYLLSLTFTRDSEGWRLLHDQNTALPSD
ncbi:YybH family protein [Paractinoplanes globisporus]|uniref:YybH family protein n=1 Tax=Paractinoplanes globisporus TaxID=113565 RepID=A0ABW6WVZ0_9ACTN|nr:SgcJ/EcaC family oxidoreductase [Actinoplanes globisporus]